MLYGQQAPAALLANVSFFKLETHEQTTAWGRLLRQGNDALIRRSVEETTCREHRNSATGPNNMQASKTVFPFSLPPQQATHNSQHLVSRVLVVSPAFLRFFFDFSICVRLWENSRLSFQLAGAELSPNALIESGKIDLDLLHHLAQCSCERTGENKGWFV